MKTFTFAIYPYIIKKYNMMFEELIEKYSITQVEIDVLAFLANNPEYNHAQDIVNIRGISKGHVSIAIEKLVKKGYVTRMPDLENRRCNVLLVTEQAMQLVFEIQDIQENFNDQAYKGMDEKQKDIYHQSLRQMYHNLGGGQNE